MRILYYTGIDIGSTCAKTAVLDEEKNIIKSFVIPTGWSSVETAKIIKERLLEDNIRIIEPDSHGKEKSEDKNSGNSLCVSTGYGRESVFYSRKRVTEISCHGRGASFLHGLSDGIIIDIGGQDTKIIDLRDNRVCDFIMNDKCSAGTGRFLEVMSNTLSVTPQELCNMAKQGGGTAISSMCTVFAESEVIGLIGKGESKENIAFAVVDSIVSKVVSQAEKFDLSNRRVCFTGGLCECDYIREILSDKLKRPVESVKYGRYAGAVGAALYAFKVQ